MPADWMLCSRLHDATIKITSLASFSPHICNQRRLRTKQEQSTPRKHHRYNRLYAKTGKPGRPKERSTPLTWWVVHLPRSTYPVSRSGVLGDPLLVQAPGERFILVRRFSCFRPGGSERRHASPLSSGRCA